MSKTPLVSIITPCYNGESFVHRYFGSVLEQTYPNLELFFIDDGSTDRTGEIAKSYAARFKERNIPYRYIYQENAGQAAAINQALPLFTGEYLTWPDSDDWMAADCIEKKVGYLESHPDKGYVLCKSAVVPEGQPGQIAGLYQRRNTASGWLFDDLLFENDIYFTPGGYMVRSSMFLSALPERRIYECKTGQNWQLLLPIAYRYECGFLDEVLNYYLVRENSHSRAEKDYCDMLAKTYRHEDTLEHVINSIAMEEGERKGYLRRIELKYIRQRLRLAARYHDKAAVEEGYRRLTQEDTPTLRDRRDHICGKYIAADLAYQAARLPVRAARKIKRMIRP